MESEEKTTEMKYEVIEGAERELLTEIVNEKLNDGWRCQGGIAVIPEQDGTHLFYIQAMVKVG